MAYFKIKVFVLGAPDCGKKTMCTKYLMGFDTNFRQSIGVDVYAQEFSLPNEEQALISFWNVSPAEKYKFHLSTFLRGAAGGFIMFDITDRESFEKAKIWRNQANKAGNVPLILIGNKYDLESERKVSYQEAKEFSENNDFLAYIETSVLENINIKESIKLLTDIVLYYRIEKGKLQFDIADLNSDLLDTIQGFSEC